MNLKPILNVLVTYVILKRKSIIVFKDAIVVVRLTIVSLIILEKWNIKWSNRFKSNDLSHLKVTNSKGPNNNWVPKFKRSNCEGETETYQGKQTLMKRNDASVIYSTHPFTFLKNKYSLFNKRSHLIECSIQTIFRDESRGDVQCLSILKL